MPLSSLRCRSTVHPTAQAGFGKKHGSGSLRPPGRAGAPPSPPGCTQGSAACPRPHPAHARHSPGYTVPEGWPPTHQARSKQPPHRAYMGGGAAGACLCPGGGQVRERGSLHAPAKALDQRDKPLKYHGKRTEVDWLKSGLYRPSNETRSPLLKYLMNT